MSPLVPAARLRSLLRGPIAMASQASLLLRLFSIGAGFAYAVLLARLLGAAEYGAYAVAASTATIVATVALLGFGLLSVRELPRLRVAQAAARIVGYLRFSRALTVGVSLAAGGVIAGLAWGAPALVGPAYARELTVVVALAPLLTLVLLLQYQTRGLGAVLRAQVPAMVGRPLVMLALLAAVYLTGTGLDAERGLLLFAGANAAAAGLAVWFALRTTPRAPAGGAEYLPRPWLMQALPFLLTSLVALARTEVNTLLLAWLSGPEQAGLFQPIVRLTPIMVMCIEAMAMPLAPKIAQLWAAGSIATLQRLLALASLAATATTLLVSAGIVAASPLILGAFGPEFTAAGPALLWIAAAQLFNAATGMVGLLLSMTMRQGDVLRCQLLGVAANLVAALALVPAHGATGAAIAIAAGIVVTNLAMILVVRRHFPFDPSLPSAIWYFVRRRRAAGTAPR